MSKPKVLITSDDGFDSMGVRTLVHVLRDQFDLKIAGTLEQQSGVGGHISLAHGGTWGVRRVDDIEALWVEGTPVDAVHCAQAYFKDIKFDLAISGINWGPNVGVSLMTSGTIAAAIRCLQSQITNRAIAISWDAPPKVWFSRVEGNQPLPKSFITYPGSTTKKIVDLCLENQFWSGELISINLPSQKPSQLKFTKPTNNVNQVYKLPPDLDHQKMTFRFPPEHAAKMETKLSTDIGALKAGYVTATIYTPLLWHKSNHDQIKTKTINLI